MFSRVSQEELAILKDKHLVECQTQAEHGVASGNLGKNKNGHPNYIVLDGCTYRIKAPEDNGRYSIILWTMDGPNDNNPTSDKIVSLFSSAMFSF